MMTKSPGGALIPCYYEGDYFHEIHYGSYLDNSSELFSVMGEEENIILKSPARRRVLIDLYQTNLTGDIIEKIVEHILRISPRIIKLAITSDKRSLRQLHKAIKKGTSLGTGQIYFCTDMEEAKAWLVSEKPY